MSNIIDTDRFTVKDSGERQQYESGAVRDTSVNKPRPDLISPFFMERMGEHLRKGAIKYAEWNWAKGIPSSRCYESAMRHLMQFAQGKVDEDHLAAAAFNIMVIIHNQEVQQRGAVMVKGERGLCDMPKFYTPEKLIVGRNTSCVSKEDYAE
jgi:hypothetical protein